MDTDQWRNGETCHDLVEDQEWLKSLAEPLPEAPEEDDAEKVERDYAVEVSGRRFDVKVIGEAFAGAAAPANGAGAAAGRKPPKRGERKKGGGGGPDQISSPLQGNMWKVVVSEGDEVEEGQLLCIIEAMKMENEINAHKAGTISELSVTEGEPIKAGDPIATITSAAADE
jgi:acetyl-CoA/propionyl-CoA carboxylase, biotin carboxylase, biotin carboxyl carrier protein